MEINTEFLLGRKEITLDTQNARNQIHSRRILVTGAAGSIGSELVNQIIKFQPSSLYLVDHWELGIYQLKLLIGEHENIRLETGDVSDKDFMFNIFKEVKPQIVFHTAAYKHVSLLEGSPYQAIKNNVIGTQTVADLSQKFKVEKFIFISTDKAVKPASLMGRTKQLSEIYLQSLNVPGKSATEFIITRLGNVFASTGSVYHTFQYQLINRLPITISDPNASRYFMTLFEASQFILEAASIGRDKEVLIFDMGEPVIILDIAKRMIQESNTENNKNADIKFTGLKSGEKLHEDICREEEMLIPTENKLITRASLSTSYFVNVKEKVLFLKKALKTKSADELRFMLETILNPDEVHQQIKKRTPILSLRNSSIQMDIPAVHMD